MPRSSFEAVQLTASSCLAYSTLFSLRVRDRLFQQVHHKFRLEVLELVVTMFSVSGATIFVNLLLLLIHLAKEKHMV